MNVVEGPTSELLERIKRGDVDLAAARRIAAYSDADAFVNLFHSTDGLLDSEEIDRLIEQGRVESDPTLRGLAEGGLRRAVAGVLSAARNVIDVDPSVLCGIRGRQSC